MEPRVSRSEAAIQKRLVRMGSPVLRGTGLQLMLIQQRILNGKIKTKNMTTLELGTSIRRSPLRLRFLLIFLALACFALSPAAQGTPDIIVNTTSDVFDLGGAQQVGDLPGPDGLVSLREAVIAANNTLGSQVIGFNIPTSDPGFNGTVFTIKPQTPGAVYLTDNGTIIDGTTQTSYSGDTNPLGPEIVLDCSQTGSGSGVEIAQSSFNTIRGLVVHSSPQAGVQFNTGEQTPNNNIIAQCYIGTDETGSVAMLNGWEGIALNGSDNIVQDNLVSGNGTSGIGFEGTANVIEGNLVGTDRTGSVALLNGGDGITFNGSDNIVQDNLVSGNGRSGISVAGTANVIEGNLVGTDRTGSVAIGNGLGPDGGFGMGIGNDASNNVIGGTAPEARNVISGNPDNAIAISNANDNHIIGNFIGTDATGQNALPNGGSGVQIVYNCSGNTVEQNVIAYNQVGVTVGFNALNNTITRNSIFSNNGLGIDLGNGGPDDYNGDGVTLNDPCDTDTGPNSLQNFPVLYSVSSSGGSTTITGALNSTSNTNFTIEFFSNDVGNPSGFGDGQTFIGSTQVITDSDCNATFTAVFPVTVSGSQVVTMTATDPNGNTSEFSSSGATPIGSDVMVNMGTVGSATDVTVTYSGVTVAGTTTVTPIDPPPPLPSGFELTGEDPPLAFDITTTATYTTPIIIAFRVSVDPLIFPQLRVLHNEGGILVDVTILDGPFAPDPTTQTIYASVSSLSPFVIAKSKFSAQVQQPVNANGSSVFSVKRGVVPVKFTLTQDGTATCALPPATIALTRTTGGTTGTVDESVYSGSADTGSNFRIDSCQYVYNLSASALGVGMYRVDIKIDGTVVGNAIFQLK
jgi:hypothetical protein